MRLDVDTASIRWRAKGMQRGPLTPGVTY